MPTFLGKLKSKTSLKVFVSFFFLLVLAPHLSFAQFGGLVEGLRLMIIGFFDDAGSLADQVLWKVANLASATLSPNALFETGFLSANIVALGWNIVLSFTNAFFIFVLLVIGFATTLRISGYGAKELLGKLIIAALLINFSLVIAGVFLDASNIAAEYFMEGAGGKNFGGYAMAKLNILPGAPPDPSAPPPPTGSPTIRLAFQALVIRLIFDITAIFIFALIAIMFVIRIIAIWVLLIFSPIIWLAWVLPYTEHHFKEWWTTFFKWCFFAPTVTFFLFIAMNVATGFDNAGALLDTSQHALVPAIFSLSSIANFLIVGGLMIAALIVAQKSGLPMASAVASWGEGAIKGAAKKLPQKGWDAFRKQREETKEARKVGGVTQAFKERYGIGVTAKQRAFSKVQAKGEREKYEKKLAKKIENIDPETLKSLATGKYSRVVGSIPYFGKARRTLQRASIDALIAKGGIDKVKGDDLKTLVSVAERRAYSSLFGVKEVGPKDAADAAKKARRAIEKTRPDIIENDDDIEELFKEMDTKEFRGIAPTAFEGAKGQKMVSKMNTDQEKAIMTGKNKKLKDAYAEALKGLVKAYEDEGLGNLDSKEQEKRKQFIERRNNLKYTPAAATEDKEEKDDDKKKESDKK